MRYALFQCECEIAHFILPIPILARDFQAGAIIRVRVNVPP